MSDTPNKTILVTGATGWQGSGVVTALLASPQSTRYTILAATRDPTSAAAQHLARLSSSIILVRGDLDNCASLFASAVAASPGGGDGGGPPVWGVYSVQVSRGRGVTEASETAQGRALVDAAVAHGVCMFVYGSVDRGGDDASWGAGTPVAHFRAKHAVELHLRAAGAAAATGGGGDGASMMWAVLRPVAFMENLRPGSLETRVFLAALRNVVPRDKKLQWVAARDVGPFAALAFDSPEEWHGRAVGLAGDELTLDEMDAVFERAAGRPAPTAHWFFGSVLTALVREMALMIGWFASDGYRADVRARRAEYPPLMDLEAYLRENKEWQAVAARS